MDGEPPRPIEIFRPFEEAYELTKAILFKPFDFTKWLVIGFAAFLASLVNGLGGGGSFNFGGDTDAFKATSGGRGFDLPQQVNEWFGWLSLTLAVVLGILILALVVVIFWLGARGQFIFTDCIVRNRAAIVEPWRNFKKEANSFFFFLLACAGAGLLLLALLFAPALALGFQQGENIGAAFWIAFVAGLGLTVIAYMVFAVFTQFVVPIMYCRRCTAWRAFRENCRVVLSRPGAVILYFLFVIVLFLAFAMIGCLATCLTCCLAAIPYVGTVLLLPLHVFIYSYELLFLRQFGAPYDAWATLPLPPEHPPLQAPATRPPDMPPSLPA